MERRKNVKITPQMDRLFTKYYNPNYSVHGIARVIATEEKTPYKLNTIRWLYQIWIERKREEVPKTEFKLEEEEDFNFPESYYEEKPFFEIPSAIERVLFISDIHIPYHDLDSLKTALKTAKEEKVDCIFLGGDIADLQALSYHDKDPNRVTLSQELEALNQFFSSLRKMFPNVKIYYKMGNHEMRYERFISKQSAELSEVVSYTDSLNLVENKIQVIDQDMISKFGDFYLLHGHEMRVGLNVINPAKQFTQLVGKNVIFGHHHTTYEWNQRAIDGSIVQGVGVGCLSGLKPFWRIINNWNHGFAILKKDIHDKVTVDNYRIDNGGLKKKQRLEV